VPVSVLLVDDVDEVRVVLRHALRLRGGFDVVAEAADGLGAVDQARQTQPDIVVLDLGLPNLAGREVLSRLRAVAPAAQVVVFSGLETPDRAAVIEEVAAYVSKDRDIDYLVDLLENLSRDLARVAIRTLSAHPSAVGEARRFVCQRCEAWGCGELVNDAALVASELVTNAVVHARAGVELRVSFVRRVLRLEVVDSGGGTPDPRVATDEDEHGRGLLLVSALSAAWGVESVDNGRKLVWAELIDPAALSQA
jgi:CheY-like chemotaxis protein/anti-sigma regulatory factor (Ser/Thr protein kinase)